MDLKSWPNWLKGGLIGLVLSLILIFIELVDITLLKHGPPFEGIFSVLMILGTEYFIISFVLVGLLYGTIYDVLSIRNKFSFGEKNVITSILIIILTSLYAYIFQNISGNTFLMELRDNLKIESVISYSLYIILAISLTYWIYEKINLRKTN
jgi:hypothetical protein